MSPQVKAQTIKQAKKSFKTRGHPSVTEQELKQLERARKLDQRAWRTREQEKRRAETAKKRVEKEKEDKLEREKAQLGSQRRHDRFGYQSSQFHLGKFFRVGSEVAVSTSKASKAEVEPECKLGAEPALEVIDLDLDLDLDSDIGLDSLSGSVEENFLGDEIDDPALLDALEPQTSHAVVDNAMPSSAKPTSRSPVFPPAAFHNVEAPADPSRSRSKAVYPADDDEDDFSSFWDDLDTSTQIARDLEIPQLSKASSCSSSFSFGDMDLTEEDLEHLDPPQQTDQARIDRVLMPPPCLPVIQNNRKMLCRPGQTTAVKKGGLPKPTLSSDRLPAALDVEFTSTQLESWIEDEIHFSQAAPD